MCDVVDLQPVRSVEFEGEMERLADRLTTMLSTVPGLLRNVRPGSHKHRTLTRAADLFVRARTTIETHVASIEEETDHIFADLVDGQMMEFQTYDDATNVIVTSTLATRCHTVRIRTMRCDPVLGLAHDIDDVFLAGLGFRAR